MSKMDELRAMREAKYARANAGNTPRTPKPTPISALPAEPSPASAEAGSPHAASPDDALCGHRSMNGRTCTREAGHAAKSHRYS